MALLLKKCIYTAIYCYSETWNCGIVFCCSSLYKFSKWWCSSCEDMLSLRASMNPDISAVSHSQKYS